MLIRSDWQTSDSTLLNHCKPTSTGLSDALKPGLLLDTKLQSSARHANFAQSGTEPAAFSIHLPFLLRKLAR